MASLPDLASPIILALDATAFAAALAAPALTGALRTAMPVSLSRTAVPHLDAGPPCRPL
jgi:hypothetical protein